MSTFRLFRLLSLFPAPAVHLETFSYTNSPEERLSDNLHSVQCPSYDALSYAWNPRSNSGTTETPQILHPVTVHSSAYTHPVTINITTHLLYGLLAVQQLCAPTWLFVDAICINQSDARDKAVQVQNIHRVFSGAERVLAWLGDDNPGHSNEDAVVVTTNEATLRLGACFPQVSTLVRMLETCFDNQDQVRTQISSYENRLHKDRSQSIATKAAMTALSALPPVASPLWPALERLRLNPWFTRLWIVQEVSLSNKVVLLYGQYSLPWQVYVRLTTLCERIVKNLPLKHHNSEQAERVRLARNSYVAPIVELQAHFSRPSTRDLGEVSREQSQPNIRQLMSVLLHTIRKSRVSLPVDRVYSIMGLLSVKMRKSIYVDYSESTLEQFTMKWIEFCQTMLAFAPNFAEEMLYSAAFLQRQTDLPSWCPNLADDSEQQTISFGSDSCAGMPGGKEWKSSNGAHTVTVIPGTRHLELLGINVDEVAHVIDLSWIEDRQPWTKIFVDQNGEIDSEVAQEILATLWQCLTEMTKRGTSTKYGDAVLARCLVANVYDDQVADSAQLQRDYLAFARYLEHHTWGPNPGDRLKMSIRMGALRFGNRFQRLARKRAFFVTTAGRSGLCPSSVQIGDGVYVLMNFQAPCVLRRDSAGESFELVGETYVDGVMRGEVFTGRDMATEKPETFLLS